MNTNEVIECYVTDVAVQLPRRQRNDVAFELRALLAEELQARADMARRPADAAMAVDFLNEFGRPADVAARYQPTLTVIDPADGRSFVRASVIGVAILWILGLIKYFHAPIASGSDLLGAFGAWWGNTVLPSLWWPGVLVVGFGFAAWARRRRPVATAWKPRATDRILGSRAALVLGTIGVLLGVSILADPRVLLDVFLDGKAAPIAYEALTYADTFRQRQGPILFVLLLANVPIFLVAIVKGRWPPALRHVQTVLAWTLCGVMAWTVLDGPTLLSQRGNWALKAGMVVAIIWTLLDQAARWYRRVRPMPGRTSADSQTTDDAA